MYANVTSLSINQSATSSPITRDAEPIVTLGMSVQLKGAPSYKVTSAPDPVTPVGGSNMPPRSLSEASTQSEYEAMRRNQSRKSNGFI